MTPCQSLYRHPLYSDFCKLPGSQEQALNCKTRHDRWCQHQAVQGNDQVICIQPDMCACTFFVPGDILKSQQLLPTTPNSTMTALYQSRATVMHHRQYKKWQHLVRGSGEPVVHGPGGPASCLGGLSHNQLNQLHLLQRWRDPLLHQPVVQLTHARPQILKEPAHAVTSVDKHARLCRCNHMSRSHVKITKTM